MALLDDLDLLQGEAGAAIEAAQDLNALEAARVLYLSRSGKLPALMEGMKTVSKEERPLVGKKLNEVKGGLETLFQTRKEHLESAAQTRDVDVTLPGRPVELGKLHLLTQVTHRIIPILRKMGFTLEEGPDIETEFTNFDALNTPKDHPARNEKDTFYIDRPAHAEEGRYLLRTHTSPVQVRVLRTQKPPIRMASIGRTYRRDEIDATHGTSFHQFEGLVVAEDVSLADLKGTLEFFFQELLGPQTRVRLRPHFFPFTEPSYEVDCSNPDQTHKGREWLEIAGCGMVDPAVLTACGVDAEKYTGFAFGMGVERLAMILHGVPDLRLFEQNDLRFLRQF